MKYCSSCGKQIPKDIKFCPYCGIEIYQNTNELTSQTKIDIKDNATSYKVHKKLEDTEDTLHSQSLPSITIVVYIALNFILKLVSPSNEEIMGIFIYTWIVLAIIFIRRNKEKPFNWLLNIFVSLQAILVFATGMMSLDYIDAGGDSIGVIIILGLLILLLITIVVMLYKGNRRTS